MKIRRNRIVLASGILLSIASVIGAMAYARNLQQKRPFPRPDLAKEPPLVVSQVQGLQITEVRLINQGTETAAIEIDVTNNRDSAVMSIDFISRDKYTSGGIAMDGLLEEDDPHSIMAPHSLRTFTMYLGGIIGDKVFLASAIFEDGKEEGDKRSLEGIRGRRIHYQRKKKTAGQNGGQQ